MVSNHMHDGSTRESLADAFEKSAFQAKLTPPLSRRSSSATLPSEEGQLTPNSLDSELNKMADASSALTRGALREITEGALATEQPVVQCLQSVLPA